MEIVNDLENISHHFDSITINDNYIGLGYGQATDEELAFYLDIAKNEGMILDPVYTGKAFKGLVTEIKNGNYVDQENILLFIPADSKAIRKR